MHDERERNPAGRPQNARPRDGLGRPLPRGADGVERIPDDVQLPPAESLIRAQELFDDGMPFHAHEILEGTWKIADSHERDLWQGLAQLAVGLTHLMRSNSAGALSLLRQGSHRIGTYPDAPYDIDVAGLMRWADGLATAVEHGERPAATVPRLRIAR